MSFQQSYLTSISADITRMASKLFTQTFQFFLIFLICVHLTNSSIILIDDEQPKSNFVPMTFDEYMVKFNKNYPTPEQIHFRRQVFENNLIELQEFIKTSSSLGITKFTDWTKEQKKSLRGKQPTTYPEEPAETSIKGASKTIQLPRTFDWRNYKVVTQVKIQQCGNCWAYATTAFFESEFIRRGQADSSIDLAEQYFMQCDVQSSGCDGGLLEPALDLGINNGIPYESEYPASNQTEYPGICQAPETLSLTKSRRITRVKISDNQIIRMLLQRPLAIGVESKTWQSYAPTTENRLLECQSNDTHPSELDHAVLLVGYTEKEWILKNQWGQDSGLDGYFYVSRDSKKSCGIGMQVHTLDYSLPPINGVIIPSDPAQSNCKFSNCIQCNKIGTKCIECQGRFKLNGKGECEQVEENNQLLIETQYTLPELMVRTNCTDTNCEQCADDEGEEECIFCKQGFALNEGTGVCEKSPSEGCNFFEIKKNRTICYECYKGYLLENNKCISSGSSSQKTSQTPPMPQSSLLPVTGQVPNTSQVQTKSEAQSTSQISIGAMSQSPVAQNQTNLQDEEETDQNQ